MSYAVASPAQASCNEECKVAKETAKNKVRREKWEAKRVGDPFNINSWAQFRSCELGRHVNPQETCYAGITLGGKTGGSFEFGRVNVPLSKSIALQGTFEGEEEEIRLFPASHGYETLDAPELPVTDGIKLFDQSTQEQEEWPAGLIESWNEAKKNKETAVNVKIEMAGNGCYEELGCIDTEHLLERSGSAFKLPLKVKVTGPWLEKLGGGPCYIGSDENPIHINLTTAGSGAPGNLSFNKTFTKVAILGSRLVDVGWKIEPASYPTGCGGAYESYVDASLTHVLELDHHPSQTGTVVLKGDLYTAFPEQVEKEGVASGEIP
ncbi:MAG TPA: hypothetical protein VHW67_03625 [Solirubrobacteraceae bacterium]|nr:hypothetical protein [Solirubrobacteraceae bacterium]